MKKFQFLTLITCAWVLGPLKIQAQNTYALIIGIAQYKKMPALQYADRDAIAFAEFVKGQGVPDQNISLFLNEDATRMNIVDELYRLSRRLKPQDRFYFYFGGHGDLEAKIGYENAMLLLHGSFKTGYFQGKEFLQLSELKTWLTALSKTQTQVIFIADACHSGGLIGGSEGQTKTQRALQESWANVTKILSSQANEFSLEGQQWGGGRGLFSFHLVNGLTGRADVNKNKLVSVKELDEYLRYHVRREASPNVQTPLVVGEPTLALAKSSASGLAQLAVAEKRNFPVISAVNFKGGNPVEKLLAKLDTGIVELYKRFSKAVKERRLADHDNAQDNALLHFRAMAGRNIPDTLLNIMKRNLGAALMERELQIMQNPREKGQNPPAFPNQLEPAIQNLEATANLFGPDHYFYNLLQARKLVLQSMNSRTKFDNMNTSVDNALDELKANQRRKIALLKQSLALEPNMVSTYLILAMTYQSSNRDSSAYYLEKVVELLPNHVEAFTSIGFTYHNFEYKDADGLDAPHPRAIHYLKKVIELDSTSTIAHDLLATNYKAIGKDKKYRDLTQAIYYQKKLLGFVEKPLDTLIKLQLNQTINKANFLKNSIAKAEFAQQIRHYGYLAYMYQKLGDTAEASHYQRKLQTYCQGIGSYQAFMNAAGTIYRIFDDFEEDLSFLNGVQDYYLLAQKSLEKEMANAAPADLPYVKVMYYEILKALGTHYRNIQDYDQAERYLLQALSYPIDDFKAENRMKLTGSASFLRENRMLTLIALMARVGGANNFHYRIEPYGEMFLLNLEQNKMEAAMQWLEKALQVSVSEKGNDTSGMPYRNIVLETYKNLDVNAFNALYEKYFPKTDEKK